MMKMKIGVLIILLFGISQPAQASIIDDVWGKVKSIFNGVGDILDDTDDIIDKADSTIRKVDSGFNSIPGFFDNLYGDVLSVVNGIDPNLVAGVIVEEFTNEASCKELPTRLNDVTQTILNSSAIDDLPIPDSVMDAVTGVDFSVLGIIGIDPATATSEDLYYYKITTVKPLETMKGITGSIFKIPFVIGAEIANACANAAEFRIGQRDGDAALVAQIHRILSTDGVNNIQFHLPESNGGHLEAVGNVIESIVETYDELEVPVSNDVRHYLAKAERYYQMGQYHRAFKSYKSAYIKLSGGNSHH